MARRIAYGLSNSENGWEMVDAGSCVWIVVPGTGVHLQIREGQPAAILGAFVADWNSYIEPVRDADSACWTPTNSVPSSNHLSGTACDVCWNSHPFQIADAGFNSAQLKTMRELLDWYEGMVFWGNDWRSPKDAMHVQMGYDTYGAANVDKVNNFIQRKIRVDGFSTFRRGGATQPPPVPGLNARTLAQVMGNRAGVNYQALLQPYRAACDLIGAAGNLNRLAMFAAQIGHESGGLQYMEEIASGSAYEGRSDLGNTQPGDGVRFKGRGPLQITGRFNYTKLSEWAFTKRLVPSPTFFVDQPAQLATPQYGFLGACWYWTVARTNINSMCDAGDILGVTRAINGGTNGLPDRTTRWNAAKAMGLAALDISGADTPPAQPEDDMAQVPQDQWDRVYQELSALRQSRSPLRHVGEGKTDTWSGFGLNTDGHGHVQLVRTLASYGDPDALGLLQEVANNTEPGREHDAKLAQAILHEVTTPGVVSDSGATQAAVTPQVVYVDRPVVAPLAAPVVVDTPTTGQLIGQAYDVLAKLQLSSVLTDTEKSPLAALIAVLQTKLSDTPEGSAQ